MKPAEITEMTIRLTERGKVVLDQAVELGGDTRIDTINRALVVYAAILRWVDKARPGKVWFTHTDGTDVVLDVNRRPWWQLW